MTRFGRIGVFVMLVGAAALAAAAFGAVHNQLSFSIGPDYFHVIKFPQFGIESLGDRAGAALVGVMASWWMGVLVGLPAFLFGLATVPDTRAYAAAGLGAIGLVILLATLAAFLGLLAGMGLAETGLLDFVETPAGAARDDILRAGLMHDASYLGGALGAVLAFWPMRRAARIVGARHAA